jgi:hypothetical protein
MSDLLIGCRAKIQRAEENIQNLNGEITAFLAAHPKPYRIVREFRNNGRQYAFVAFGNPTVPPRFAVLAGEIIHHLRSSLDHLICALVKKQGGTPTRKHQFPIYTSAKKFDEACANGLIKGVSVSAEKLIRSVQPYTSKTPDDTGLYVIQQYDNLDKHQLLIVSCTVLAIGDQIAINPKVPGIAITGMTPPNMRKVNENGVVVFSIDLANPATDAEFEAEANLVHQIAFEKCGRQDFAEITHILTGLLQGTVGTIDLFSDEL